MKKGELHFSVIILFLVGFMVFSVCLEATKLYFVQNKLQIFTSELALELERTAIYDFYVEVREEDLRRKLQLQEAILEKPTGKLDLNSRFTIKASIDYPLNFFLFRQKVKLTSTTYGKVQYYFK